jgi:uncharacterized integral membrane protein
LILSPGLGRFGLPPLLTNITGGSPMNRIKLIIIIVLAVIGIIVVLQNTSEVNTQILFMTITMPHAILLFITLLLGFVLGVLVSMFHAKAKELKGDTKTSGE